MRQLEKAIQRINNINWDKEVDRKSNDVLMNEAIRRGSIFRDRYETEMKGGLPFFSAAQIINVQVPDDMVQMRDYEKLINKGFWAMAYTCRWYLEWMYLYDQGNEIAKENVDLYEPLIKLIERGGHFMCSGELTCGRYVWLKRNFYTPGCTTEAYNISDKYLDQIDMEQE